MELKITHTNRILPVPDRWQDESHRLPPSPDLPQMINLPGPNCFATVIIHPISKKNLMPYHRGAVLAEVCRDMPPNAAMIEVELGKTVIGCPFLYQIVKTHEEDKGLGYDLNLQMIIDGQPIMAEGYFGEGEDTPSRELTILQQYRQEFGPEDGPPTPARPPWMRDPYTGDTKGWQMNLSELPQYDAQFPDHPLSVARRFISDSIMQLR